MEKFLQMFLHLLLLEVMELFFFFSDDAHFKVNGCVNKQNMCYWLADNPNWQITKSLHSE